MATIVRSMSINGPGLADQLDFIVKSVALGAGPRVNLTRCGPNEHVFDLCCLQFSAMTGTGVAFITPVL